MTNEFRLPDIGEGLTEAEIVRWLVPVGERVEADQPIVEVETDKAVVEIPSPYAGIVLEHGGAEGEIVDVGSVLVVIGDEDAAAKPAAPPVSSEAVTEELEVVVIEEPGPVAEPKAVAPPIVGTLNEDAEVLDAPVGDDGPEPDSAVRALPLVRKLARDKGVDLTTVHGSGPAGRITREDVLAAAETEIELEPEGMIEPDPVEIPTAPVPVLLGDERHKMSRLRRTIAANMAKSWAEVPHVTTFDDVDATRLLDVRDALGVRHRVKIPLEALVVKAVIPALRTYPEFNATLDGEDLIVHAAHDVGIAVDTPDGLLVAVIREAGSKSVIDLAEDVRRLGESAKDRSLGPEELTGQTFTVSNIGAVGGGHGTPIVPPGTTAILSIGRIRERPVVHNGQVAIAPVMPLSLSYDHRAIDGGMGRRFVALVMENLEEPALFLAD